MSLLFELHEFAFFVLGAAAIVLPRRDLSLRLAPRFWLLGTFGIAQALFALFDWERHFRATQQSATSAPALLCLTVGYLALLEFARSTYPTARRPPAWLTLAAAGASAGFLAMSAADPLLGFAVGVASLIGLPAALLTGISLFRAPRSSPQMHRGMAAALRTSGVAFILYALLAPVVPARDSRFPAWLPTEAAFQAATGLSVEVLRGLAAVIIAVAFVVLVRQASAMSNADLVRVMNALDGFVYRCKNDRDWTMIYMTNGVEELCGYRADEFLGERSQTWGGLIHSQDAERIWNEVQAALEARHSFELSYRIRARDGTIRWVRGRGQGVFDASGKLLFLDGHVTNDTRRMRTLAELRTLGTAIESSLNAVAIADLRGNILYVNRAFIELWRLSQAEDALGRPGADFLADKDVAEAAITAMVRERTWQGVLRARRADGSTPSLHVLAQVISDGAGNPTATMASFIDLSEQFRLADELKIERDFATNLIATAPVIILLLDPQGRIKHINAYGAALLGYTLEELVGKEWVPNFVPQAEQSRIQRLFETATSGIPTRANLNAIVTRSGELREIEWNDRLMQDARGNTAGLLAIGVDVSERKRSLEAVRASQKQARDILDGMFAFVGLFSLEGEVLEINRAPLAAANLKREDVVGRSLWKLGPFCASAQAEQRARDAFRRAAAGEMVRQDVELTLGPDRIMTVDAAFGPVRDESGRVQRVVGSAVDVTEQRELERQRLHLEAELRQSQKLEALGTLAGGIAHDFNNVLLAIIGNAELARVAADDRARVDESLTEIDKAARRAQDLVQRILAFSRRHEHTLKHIGLRPVVEEALKLLRSTLPARIDLQLETSGEDVPVMGDASQIHQVIMNLTTNAWHAIGDQPGKVTVTIGTEWIESGHMATELQPGRYVRIDVADSGSGMPPGVLERAFEPFFTTKPAGHGTGLGLSVAHGIMKAHGGGITVDSAPGEGSTFHLYFPAAEAEVASQEAPPPSPHLQGAGEHILYVDDEHMLVAIGTRMLESMGYRITGETSGERALAAFRANVHDFDVVVTDNNMPGISGIELAREILKLSPETPVVLVSGFLREDELQRTLDLGIAEVVMKPTTYEHLGTLIRAIMDRRRVKQAARVA